MPDIHDILHPLPLNLESIGSWGVLILILCLVLLYFLWRKQKSKKHNFTPPEPHPYDAAILELIQSRDLIHSGKARLLAFRLSAIIRQYIEKAYRVYTPQKTTEEFLHELHKNRRLKDRSVDHLARFLEICDLIKFAHKELPVEDQELLYNKAFAFLDTANDELLINNLIFSALSIQEKN